MDGETRIVIVDRSELAANLYKLLFVELPATLVIRRRFEEARPHFFRREGVKLAIFNSNIFGKKFADIMQRLLEDEPLRRVNKIFICKENPSEVECREKLGHLPNSKMITRPFHPDEFLKMVKELF